MKFEVESIKNGIITDKHDWFVNPDGKLYCICNMTGDLENWHPYILETKIQEGITTFVLK